MPDDPERSPYDQRRPDDVRSAPRQRRVLLLAGAANGHGEHADDHRGCRHQHGANAGKARVDGCPERAPPIELLLARERMSRLLPDDRPRSIGKGKIVACYNEARTPLSLGKDAPCTRPIERFGDIIAQPILGGLHHRCARN
jgi:hypothetical protein